MAARKGLPTLRLNLKHSGSPMIYSTVLLTAHSAFAVNVARQQVSAGAGAYHKSFSLSRGFRGIKVWSERLCGKMKKGTQKTPLFRMPSDMIGQSRPIDGIIIPLKREIVNYFHTSF